MGERLLAEVEEAEGSSFIPYTRRIYSHTPDLMALAHHAPCLAHNKKVPGINFQALVA